MRIRLSQAPSRPARPPKTRKGGKPRPEVDRYPGTSLGVQLIVYDNPVAPSVYQGSGRMYPDGTVDVDVAVPAAPQSGTGIQIVIYVPEDDPVVIEGTTVGDGQDGTIGISIGRRADID